MPASRPIAERFWEKVERRGPDECWPWRGYRNAKGYGRIAIGGGCGRHRPAQQVAWEMEHGRTFPRGLFACHSCDNPWCVNPAHIWPGTDGDNTRDMAAKGRHAKQQVTHCPRGHEYTPENTHWQKGRWRDCKRCRLDYKKRRRQVAAGKAA